MPSRFRLPLKFEDFYINYIGISAEFFSGKPETQNLNLTPRVRLGRLPSIYLLFLPTADNLVLQNPRGHVFNAALFY